MNEIERTALNEILRTVTYIAEKVDEINKKDISIKPMSDDEFKSFILDVGKATHDNF